MASSSIVIKVKYGNTLRRFNAAVRDERLDLDMVMLRDKIRGLFLIAPDVDFTLNYVDEDGDLVTFADEDDLRDIVRQSLDPLRMTVKLGGNSSVPMVGKLMEKVKSITQKQLSDETVKEPKFPVHAEGGSCSSKKKAVQIQEANGGVKLGDAQPTKSLDLNVLCFDPQTFHYPDNKGVDKFVCRNCACNPKLDSRFVLDVNIRDGTLMAPETGFTKIWRMENNGNVYWPHGSQLRWIAGDRLSDVPYVDVEIPFEGFPMGKETDIAVSLTAPKLPGRYVSYWRMVTPCGQMFGQRVWVLIQVDACVKDMDELSPSLNLPSDTKDPRVHQDSLMKSALLDHYTIMTAMNGEDPFFDARPKDREEMNFPLDGMRIHSTTPATGSMDSHGQEESLLRELEDMGFMEVDLNKEVVRMNEYNLEKSVDDLCGVSGWDPVLDIM